MFFILEQLQLVLKRVLHVLHITKNFSISWLDSDDAVVDKFIADVCFLKDKITRQTLLKCQIIIKALKPLQSPTFLFPASQSPSFYSIDQESQAVVVAAQIVAKQNGYQFQFNAMENCCTVILLWISSWNSSLFLLCLHKFNPTPLILSCPFLWYLTYISFTFSFELYRRPFFF